MSDHSEKSPFLIGAYRGKVFGVMAQFRDPSVSLRARAIHTLLRANPYRMDLDQFIASASHHEDDSKEEILDAIYELKEFGWVSLIKKGSNPANDFLPAQSWDSEDPRRGFVYLVKSVSGTYRIGSTEDILSEHLMQLTYEHPGGVELVAHLMSWDIAREEKYLKVLFWGYQCHGQWLSLDTEAKLKEILAKFEELDMDPNKGEE